MPTAKRRRCPEAWLKAWENRRLVLKAISKYNGIGIDEGLAYDAGMDALCAAYERFDPSKVSRKGDMSYHYKCITKAISKCVMQDRCNVHVPEWVRRMAVKCMNGRMSLDDIQESETRPTDRRQQVSDAIRAMSVRWGAVDDVGMDEEIPLHHEVHYWEAAELDPRRN